MVTPNLVSGTLRPLLGSLFYFISLEDSMSPDGREKEPERLRVYKYLFL